LAEGLLPALGKQVDHGVVIDNGAVVVDTPPQFIGVYRQGQPEAYHGANRKQGEGGTAEYEYPVSRMG